MAQYVSETEALKARTAKLRANVSRVKRPILPFQKKRGVPTESMYVRVPPWPGLSALLKPQKRGIRTPSVTENRSDAV
jgi:hypothetical protein